ncbi:MAG TPA: uracil-DNA glycosylase [Candidatus Acidoferrales bacterium]|nr:uracil-DNA glycosylase [Candidatus Acidoferrales bacterium]
MNPEGRARVEAWLEYFNDLGISHFCLDRAAATLQSASAPVQPISAVSEPLSRPVRMASAAASPSQTHVASVLPVIKSNSLFAANESVEGDTLERIREDIGENCRRCKLCEQRNQIVFGAGAANADLVFVGEGPGHDEDIQGLPFVGRAGKLLTQMIEAMGLRRDDVYIANVVKCRPPQNRAPEPDEIETCSPFLYRQLAVIRPKAVVCLGAIAFQSLTGTRPSMSRIRGQWLEFRGIPLMATYHPAYLLRNPNAKGDVWEDLKKVMAHLGLKLPTKR